MRIITIKVNENFLQKIDRYAVNNRLSRSEVVRLALEKFLENYTENKENNEVRIEEIVWQIN